MKCCNKRLVGAEHKCEGKKRWNSSRTNERSPDKPVLIQGVVGQTKLQINLLRERESYILKFIVTEMDSPKSLSRLQHLVDRIAKSSEVALQGCHLVLWRIAFHLGVLAGAVGILGFGVCLGM